ncbi:hypothetical protein L1887_02825 [Cichorium endivia]|nr:hypothetical protein L1887_02825 [Cichorium endivia]
MRKKERKRLQLEKAPTGEQTGETPGDKSHESEGEEHADEEHIEEKEFIRSSPIYEIPPEQEFGFFFYPNVKLPFTPVASYEGQVSDQPIYGNLVNTSKRELALSGNTHVSSVDLYGSFSKGQQTLCRN